MQVTCSVTLAEGFTRTTLSLDTHQVLALNLPQAMLVFHYQCECRASSPECPAIVWGLKHAYEAANTI